MCDASYTEPMGSSETIWRTTNAKNHSCFAFSRRSVYLRFESIQTEPRREVRLDAAVQCWINSRARNALSSVADGCEVIALSSLSLRDSRRTIVKDIEVKTSAFSCSDLHYERHPGDMGIGEIIDFASLGKHSLLQQSAFLASHRQIVARYRPRSFAAQYRFSLRISVASNICIQ